MKLRNFASLLLVLSAVALSGCVQIPMSSPTAKADNERYKAARERLVTMDTEMEAKETALNQDCAMLWEGASEPGVNVKKSKNKLAVVEKNWGLQQLYGTVGRPTSVGKCMMIIYDGTYWRPGTVHFYQGSGYVITDSKYGTVLRVNLSNGESGYRPQTVFLNSAQALQVRNQRVANEQHWKENVAPEQYK